MGYRGKVRYGYNCHKLYLWTSGSYQYSSVTRGHHAVARKNNMMASQNVDTCWGPLVIGFSVGLGSVWGILRDSKPKLQLC